MIKLIFRKDREILNFAVINKEVYYQDRVWENGVRLIPKDENIVKLIVMSRNRLPPIIKALSQAMSEKDKEEYNACKTEQDIADKIRLDCKKQGLVMVDMKVN